MPKKDTASAVLGMLSSAGAQTRRPAAAPTPSEAPAVERAREPTAAPEPIAPTVEPAPEPAPASAPSASVSTLPSNRKPASTAEEPAPRTLRLRPDTATALRTAWLEAKRDDVLLTAQDFASSLMEDALARHHRRRAAAAASQ
jgi:hypothetical protein